MAADDVPLGIVGGSINRLVGRMAPTVIDSVDISAVIERVDVDALVQRVDVAAVVDRVDVGGSSSGSMSTRWCSG